jgi:hypothetical protein
MVRTQIQLTDQQAAGLKKQANEEGVSLAELVRRGVELYLRNHVRAPDEERRRRALAIVGRFASKETDLSENHDKYLAEAYDK